MNKWLLAALLIAALVACLLWRGYRHEREGRQRAERNAVALATDVDYYRTANGDLVAKVAGLELSRRDLEKLVPALNAEIAALDVKLKNALSAQQVKTEFVYVHPDTVWAVAAGDTAVRFEITDPWLRARVTVEDGRMIPPGGFEIVEIPNVQTAVAEVKYRGWWLWRRSVGLTLHVRNSNPHVRVTEGVFVDLRKKK